MRRCVIAVSVLVLSACSLLEETAPAPGSNTLLADYYRARASRDWVAEPVPTGADIALAARMAQALSELDATGNNRAAAARGALGDCDGTQASTNGLCVLLASLLDDLLAEQSARARTDSEKGELKARLDRLDAELTKPKALAAEQRIATLESRMARQATELERLQAQLDELAAIEPSLGSRYQEAEPPTPAAGPVPTPTP